MSAEICERGQKKAYPVPERKKRSRIRRPARDRVFAGIVAFVLFLIVLICLYPLYFFLINSASSAVQAEQGNAILIPHEFCLSGFADAFAIPGFMRALGVSLSRTVLGGVLTAFSSAFLGYMFTRKSLWHGRFWYRFVVIGMFFETGLIPWTLTMQDLGMRNSFLVYILPLIVQPVFVVICKNAAAALPEELGEASLLEGTGIFGEFFYVVLPQLRPVVTVVLLLAAAGQWNAFLDTLMMVTDSKLFTLQFILWQTLRTDASSALNADPAGMVALNGRMATAVLLVLPVIAAGIFIRRESLNMINGYGLKK